jgi:hypothetical protein
VTLRASAALLVGAATVVALATPSSAQSGAIADGNEGVVLGVTVTTIPYAASDDRFLIGPYRSRLKVLVDDAGLPDSSSLRLLDPRGLPRVSRVIQGIGRIVVGHGFVLVGPVRGPEGTASFIYEASSPNGPTTNAVVLVRHVPRVIVAADDHASTREGRSVTVDVAANDRVVVRGAHRVCRPEIFLTPPGPVNPLPIVLPDPLRSPVSCPSVKDRTGRSGSWAVDRSGRIVFTPAKHFRGTTSIYYRQDATHPFDLAVARLTVAVRSATAVEAVHHGGDRGTGGPRDGLPVTGGSVAILLLLAGASLGAGLSARAAGRRQPEALEA